MSFASPDGVCRAGPPRRKQFVVITAQSSRHTVLAGWAQLYLVFGVKHGIPPEDACAAAGITIADVVDRDRHIPRAWAIALQQHLRVRLPELALSLELGRFFSLEHLGYLGYAVRSCATPLEALRLLARSARLADTAYRDAGARVEECGDTFVFRTRRIPNDPLESVEMALVSMVHHLRQFLRGPVQPEKVCLAHLRERALQAQLERFFECPVELGCEEHALYLAGEVMTQPLSEADEGALQHFSAQIQGQLAALDSPVESLAGLIEARLGRDELDQAKLAKALGVSRRGLQRHLQQHGASYSELLARARRSVALRLLADPKLAVYEVALAVGYDDVRAFNRAFRRWTGTTPTEHRARARRGAVSLG